jgi:hypothetical protein
MEGRGVHCCTSGRSSFPHPLLRVFILRHITPISLLAILIKRRCEGGRGRVPIRRSKMDNSKIRRRVLDGRTVSMGTRLDALAKHDQIYWAHFLHRRFRLQTVVSRQDAS